ncbi:hypothetical protein GRI43_13755 [Altererythrobacter luteolus]|uniref:Uncharacterized protein n=1 Tax=Pontixanthobacter luteolus TaxID=295089 RepID=A0A6I4V9E3_9SPHN|nr:hypothetical protein [Pontixanthobacter luteolus]MXP48452.1 hypothetical protein [Pontixanthobacter luteolus]
MASIKAGEPFYQRMAIVLTAIVIAGFGSAQLTGTAFGSLANPLILAHGTVFLGWYVLLIVQPRLIAGGNWALHKRLGMISLAFAALIVALGYWITREAYARPEFSIAGMDGAGSTIFPVTDIINFVIIYALAFWNRKNAQAHKRLMLLAGLMMLDPAAARLVLSFGGPPPVIMALHLALYAAFFVHDWKMQKRPHWATVTAFSLFVLAMIAKFTIAGGPWWANVTARLFG